MANLSPIFESTYVQKWGSVALMKCMNYKVAADQQKIKNHFKKSKIRIIGWVLFSCTLDIFVKYVRITNKLIRHELILCMKVICTTLLRQLFKNKVKPYMRVYTFFFFRHSFLDYSFCVIFNSSSRFFLKLFIEYSARPLLKEILLIKGKVEASRILEKRRKSECSRA